MRASASAIGFSGTPLEPPTGLAVLGISYRSAPVSVRERLSVPASALEAALRQLRALGAEEAVIVSTCNRVEYYWAGGSTEAIQAGLRSAWEATAGEPLGTCLYRWEGFDAAVHLFRVAAGLDSMVLGEPQILGQVKGAYQAALAAGTTGRRLNRLFQQALHAGKRARTETGIAHGITSVASAAVVLAERIFSDLGRCRVLILGAGQMAESAARHLASRKTQALFVANRTLASAQRLARDLQAEALSWDAGLARMTEIDIAICSTASPDILLTPPLVADWMERRGGRPLFLIDIAVPRNVDPAVHKIDNVYLYDVDDMKAVVAEQAARKEADVQAAEALVLALAVEAWRRAPGRSAPPLWPAPQEGVSPA